MIWGIMNVDRIMALLLWHDCCARQGGVDSPAAVMSIVRARLALQALDLVVLAIAA